MRKACWGVAAASAALAAVVGAAATVERTRVQLDRFTVAIDKRGLPPGGLVILHLSDFHFRGGGRIQEAKLRRLQRLLAGLEYDIVALTGDLIHDESGLPAALGFLAALQPRLGAFSVPGNRDYWESGLRALWGPAAAGEPRLSGRRVLAAARRAAAFLRDVTHNRRTSLRTRPHDVAAMHAALAGIGIRPLVNQAVRVHTADADLWVVGVDDLTRGAPDLAAALAGVAAAAPVLLLSHHPDVLRMPEAAAADLLLAGHTHGGQVRLPLVGAPYMLGTHLPRRRPAGWFRRGRTVMFVSRGLGESYPLRLAAPPQAALIRLVAPAR